MPGTRPEHSGPVASAARRQPPPVFAVNVPSTHSGAWPAYSGADSTSAKRCSSEPGGGPVITGSVCIRRTRLPASRPLSGAVTILVIASGLFSAGTSQGATDVPLERQVLILTRALAYDRELRGRAGD